MDKTKVAAIWCRVSTHDQRELSLDAQEEEVQRVLANSGFETPAQYVLKVDWTSLDLMACPEFQMLIRWIASGEVGPWVSSTATGCRLRGFKDWCFSPNVESVGLR